VNTNKKDIVGKGDVDTEDPTCTKGRKRKRSDKENSGRMEIRIKFRGLKELKVKISVKIRT
jgi:hypothetical protein